MQPVLSDNWISLAGITKTSGARSAGVVPASRTSNTGNKMRGPFMTKPKKRPQPIRFTLRFMECEHEGDLDNYINYCFDAGANRVSVVQRDFDTDETALVEVTVADPEHFKIALDDTDASGFYE